MAETATYDPKKVTVIVNGTVITGFAADGVVTLTRNEDSVTMTAGAQGDVSYSENANESGMAAITLSSTSASLGYLRSLAISRKPIHLSIADANATDEIHVDEEECRIQKVPDAPRTKDPSTVTINILIPHLNYR